MTYTNGRIPWKVGHLCAASKGPLTTEQVERLSEKYSFCFAKIRQLSKDIRGVLAEELHLSQPEFRQGLRDRANKESARSIKDLEKATAQLDKVSEAIDTIKFSNPLGRIGAENPSLSHLEKFSDGKAKIEDFLRFLRVVDRSNQSNDTDRSDFAFRIHHKQIDKRRIKDVRREIVVTQIFNMWERSGRSLSYTTDPISSMRSGQLFDFVNDVVACLTEPSTPIDTDTLKTDLDAFKNYPASKK